MGSLLRSSIFWYADKFPQKGLRGSRMIHTHGKRLKDELSGKSLPPMKDVRQTPRRGSHYVTMFEMEPLDWVMSRKRDSHACTGYVGTLCTRPPTSNDCSNHDVPRARQPNFSRSRACCFVIVII